MSERIEVDINKVVNNTLRYLDVDLEEESSRK